MLVEKTQVSNNGIAGNNSVKQKTVYVVFSPLSWYF